MNVPDLPPVLLHAPRTYEGLRAVECALAGLVAPLVGTVVDLGGGYGVALKGSSLDTPCGCDFRSVVLAGWPRAAGWRGVLGLPARAVDLPTAWDYNSWGWQGEGGRNTAERRLIALQHACGYFEGLGRGIAFEEVTALPLEDRRTWRELRGPCTPERFQYRLATSLGLPTDGRRDELADLEGRLRLLAISGLPDAAWRVAWAASAYVPFPGTSEELSAMALAVAAEPARPTPTEQR